MDIEEDVVASLHDVVLPYVKDTKIPAELIVSKLLLEKSKIYNIIGSKNSGKNNLLKCLCLLNKPTSGSVYIGNKELISINKKSLIDIISTVSYIGTPIELMPHKNIYENIAFPLQMKKIDRNKIQISVQDILSKLSISNLQFEYPNSISKLEQLKVVIARALVINPKILLCEDIFSDVDIKNKLKLAEFIRDYNKKNKITAILSSNDPEVTKIISDKNILIQNGKIIEEIETDLLFMNPKSDIGKEFLKTAARTELPLQLRNRIIKNEKNNYFPLLRICCYDKTISEVVLSNAINKFGFNISILSAQQEVISDKTINVLFAKVNLKNDLLTNIVNFFNDKKCYCEVLGYVPGNV